MEEDLGLASPDDGHELDTGYFPATGKFRFDLQGATLLRFRILMLARFHPRGPGQAAVDHVIFGFNPKSACVVELSTYVRTFPVFLDHYPIRDLLLEALSRRSVHVEES